MTVKEFINEYNNKKNNSTMLGMFLKDHIYSDKHITYEEKINDCERILKYSCYEKDYNENNVFKVNTVLRLVLFYINLFQRYSDIEFEDNNNIIVYFDDLDKNGIISILKEKINRKEYDDYNAILNMMLDDLIRNEHSVISYLERKISTISRVFENTEFVNLTKEFIMNVKNNDGDDLFVN